MHMNCARTISWNIVKVFFFKSNIRCSNDCYNVPISGDGCGLIIPCNTCFVIQRFRFFVHNLAGLLFFPTTADGKKFIAWFRIFGLDEEVFLNIWHTSSWSAVALRHGSLTKSNELWYVEISNFVPTFCFFFLGAYKLTKRSEICKNWG